MIHLQHSGLRVSILDPVADKARLGSRYCVGGYVWQIHDDEKGDLLSGPKFPSAEPGGWDGQGIPEAFEIALDQHQAKVGGEVWVIGVGRVKRESPVKPFHVRENLTVVEFAPWKIETDISTASCVMTSRQTFRDWDILLTRRIALEGRTLVSATTVKNVGKAEVPIRWFAHPFFPHAGWECCRPSVECVFPAYVPKAGGFRFNAEGFIERVPEFDWKVGCFQLLSLPFGFPLNVVQKHPTLGEVKVECRFPVAWMPIWANYRTNSFEPYHHTVLSTGALSDWSIRYGF